MKYLYVEVDVNDSVKFERLIYHSEFSFDKNFEQAGHKIYRLPISETMGDKKKDYMDIKKCIEILMIDNHIVPISLVIKESLTENVSRIEKNINKLLKEAWKSNDLTFTDKVTTDDGRVDINGLAEFIWSNKKFKDELFEKNTNLTEYIKNANDLNEYIDSKYANLNVSWELEIEAREWGIKDLYKTIKDVKVYIMYDILVDDLTKNEEIDIRDIEIELDGKDFNIEIETNTSDMIGGGIKISNIELNLINKKIVIYF